MDWEPTDPFLLLKKEVERTLSGVKQVYSQWENTQDPDEAAWAASEVKTGVKNMEWDLQDLEKAIEMAKMDTKRFQIPQSELDERIRFISDTRSHIQSMLKRVSEAPAKQGNAVRHNRNQLGIENPKTNKYAALEREIQADHGRYVQGHQQMQQEMYEEQEKGLGEVSIAVDTLHHMSNDMNDELVRQAKDLEQFDTEITSTSARVGRAIRKVDELITKVDNKAGYWIIALLLVLLIILFVVFFLI